MISLRSGVLILILTLIISISFTASPSAQEGLIPNQDTVIDELELELSQEDVELGSTIEISYGVKAANGSYLTNISQLLLLQPGDREYTDDTINHNDTTILLNESSQPELQTYFLETIPLPAEALDPGVYTVHYLTNEFNMTNLNISRQFNIFLREGPNLQLIFTDVDTNQRIGEFLDLTANETKEVNITIFNAGVGNAIDITISLDPINGPHQYIPGQNPSPISVIPSQQQAFMNFSVSTQKYGIGVFTFTVRYNNSLGTPFTDSVSFTSHTIPQLLGTIQLSTPNPRVGLNSEFEVTVINTAAVNVQVKVFLQSKGFAFADDQEIQLEPGTVTLDFTGLSLSNGTQLVDLFIVYIDPNGEDEYAQRFDRLSVVVSSQSLPDLSNINFLTGMLFVLYLMLFILIVGTFFSKSVRKFVLTHLIRQTFVPDIEFELKSVVIDGSNVAWEELDEHGKPKIENILVAIEELERYGFEDIVVVADAALRYQISNPEILDDQSRTGIIKVLPAKVDGDSFILRLSREKGSLILTNDLYREYRDEFKWVDDRRIPFSILDGKMYLHPIYDI